MRALCLDFDQRLLGEREVAEPLLVHPDDVLFRVLEVGICGTDRALARFAIGRPPDGQQHMVIGHEVLGEVVAVGSAVTGLERGDLVVPAIRRACNGPCDFCARGRRDGCLTGTYTERGIIAAHGYFTDLAVDREVDLVRIPPELRDVAILMEPLSVVEKAVRLALQAYEGRPRLTLVLGAGPIGILSALVLLARGLEVVVYSLEGEEDPRARIVSDAGATYVRGNVPLAGVVIEAAGSGEAGLMAIRQLAPSGVAVILGATNTEGPIPFRDLILGNHKIIGSVNANPRAFEDAVHDLKRIDRRHLRALIERVGRRAYSRTMFDSRGMSPKLVHVLEG